MILWDSRTIHCSSPSLKSMEEMKRKYNIKMDDEKVENKRNLQLILLDDLLQRFDDKKDKKIELLRAVCMVCMTPKYKASKSVLIQRINGYINQYSLSHWPHEFVVLHKPELNSLPNYLKKNDIKHLDEMEKSLTGITDQLVKQCGVYHNFYYLK